MLIYANIQLHCYQSLLQVICTVNFYLVNVIWNISSGRGNLGQVLLFRTLGLQMNYTRSIQITHLLHKVPLIQITRIIERVLNSGGL